MIVKALRSVVVADLIQKLRTNPVCYNQETILAQMIATENNPSGFQLKTLEDFLFLLDNHKLALKIIQYLILKVSKEPIESLAYKEVVDSLIDAVDYDNWLMGNSTLTNNEVQQKVSRVLDAGLLPVTVTLLHSLFDRKLFHCVMSVLQRSSVLQTLG